MTFALAYLPERGFPVFDDPCCILSASSEIKIGPYFFNPPVLLINKYLLNMYCCPPRMLFDLQSIDEDLTFLMVSEQCGVEWNPYLLWFGFYTSINAIKSAHAF